jgi:hypothetical protein
LLTNALLDLEHVSFLDDAQITSNRNVNNQSKGCWCSSTSLSVHDFFVHDVAVWHMGCVSKIIGPQLFE